MKKVIYNITHWETWHWLIKYIPIFPAWLWYSGRAGSWWFFTPSNPTLTFGGFCGESKREMYEQLPPAIYPTSIYITPSQSFDEVQEQVELKKFTFPLAVKPNVGLMGFMFRKIDNHEQLKSYHSILPVDYIIQDYINYPLEVSVFYYRYPNERQGTITGFLKKEYLEVEGDGKSTLWELILRYPRVEFRLNEMRLKHEKKLNNVIPVGENFYLSYALNLSRGGKLVSLASEKDERLLKIFDDLSHSTNFYFGRYDIKCMSVEELKNGKNFKILEYNGSGAEPHHVYGDGNTLMKACKILASHWAVLYRISKYNHGKGVNYWSHKEGLNFLKASNRNFQLLKKLDAEFEI